MLIGAVLDHKVTPAELRTQLVATIDSHVPVASLDRAAPKAADWAGEASG